MPHTSNRRIGVVKFFNTKKRYGRLTVEGQPDVFFRFNDGHPFFERDGEARWDMKAKVQKDPKEGDRIRLCLDKRGSEPRACPWGFEEEAEAIEASNTARAAA